MTQIEENLVNGTCSLKENEIVLDENEDDEFTDYFPKDSANDLELSKENVEYTPRIKWPDLAAQMFIHFGCVYGFYLCLTQAKALTSLWAFVTIYTSGFGITAGVHRLWSHRAYKAKWPLRLLLAFLFTITGQRDVHTWVLDHRIHHKYSETDADPHNVKRGFFFAHVGWLFTTPHPSVIAKRKIVDMRDLESDPIVMWQKTLYIPLFALLAIALPVWVPYYFWNETLWNSFWVNFNFRFSITLNIAFFVNSVAHLWGQRPYDKNISPVENIAVSLAALGEGWHNYHHVFPFDYKTGELGNYSFNWTTGFIDFFEKIGWAYDLKSVSPEMVKRRADKCGDGSHESQIWGFGDRDMPKEDFCELKKMERKNN
ncbi:acyl-CoA Delta-9 desaturase [Leptopilina heterotoma]|uniref:acyl-CoA Delta-9 desaturase n=1 Tax=Leptopilina heterotoma TaxID=63436 RepID=UPI001CA9EC84|nr:acyl-CoA Delta-9 desaturase [Leptopilina heterotoma]XP_043478845.1 acyl-CoA Delta-9 desaturase [Leptopilina heterotoma]